MPETSQQDPQIEESRRLVYLSAERSLLMWIRTGLTLMIVGYASERFELFAIKNHLPRTQTSAWNHWLGDSLLALGVITLLVSAIRFGRYTRRYARGDSDPGRGLPLAIALAVLIAVVGLGIWVDLYRISAGGF